MRLLIGFFLGGLVVSTLSYADYVTTRCRIPVTDTFRCWPTEGQPATFHPLKCRVAQR